MYFHLRVFVLRRCDRDDKEIGGVDLRHTLYDVITLRSASVIHSQYSYNM